MTDSVRLTRREISKLVFDWIGVDGGYLGDFSYNSHDRFWLDVCDKEVDTRAFPGPTRECFIKTLYGATAAEQAAVLEEVLEQYPADELTDDPKFRTPLLHDQIQGWISRLRTGEESITPSLAAPSEVVRRALVDAETLLRTSGATSAVDRVHTAMHGYLRSVCAEQGIEVTGDQTINRLLKALKAEHPAFADVGARGQDTARVLQGLATAIDALNPLRNHASVAHPNETLLDEPEARLVCNAVGTILNYIEARLRFAPAPQTVPVEEPF